jgi:adenylate cyclase class 2
MAFEIETKVLNIEVPVILDKLIKLGAEKVLETRLFVTWYRNKGVKTGEDPWFLRVRTDSAGGHEVTWKAKSDILGTARKHKEINFRISDSKKLADLFEKLGLESYAYQEKDRISFIYKDWRFDLDQYPKVPAFLEIEGKSESHVRDAMKLLDVEKNATWAKGERLLIESVYKLNWHNMRF